MNARQALREELDQLVSALPEVCDAKTKSAMIARAIFLKKLLG